MRSERRLLDAGMRYYRCGRIRRAEEACNQLLQLSPEHPDGLQLLALLTARNGNPHMAATLLTRAIRLHGPKPELCLTLGQILRDQGDLASSSACFRQALRTDPDCAEAHFQAGLNLTMESRLEEATAAYIRTVDLNPRHAAAWCRMSNILQSLGRAEESLSGYEVVLRLEPENGDALLQRARAFCQLDRMEEALPAYETALRHWRHLPDAHNEMGIVLRAVGEFQLARKSYVHATELDPHHARARWNLSLLDLLCGRFEEGWKGYECRFTDTSPLLAGVPEWSGEPLNGQRILLHAEQGFGDAIQFVRYASMVHGRGGSVFLACRPELHRLLARVEGVKGVVAPDHLPPGIMTQAALMSLPGIFGTVEATIPGRVPYLHAGRGPVAAWRGLLDVPPGHRRIGVVWAGSATHRNDRNRSLPAHALLPLARVPHATFFSLQPGVSDPPPPLRPMPREPKDFADTAAMLLNLDLVIAVDTAVAHLAGALARPVWTLLPAAPDWRWMLHRSDSPWYPTMRLFRQPARHQWDAVIQEVVHELTTF